MRWCRSVLEEERNCAQHGVVLGAYHLRMISGAWLALVRYLFRKTSATLGSLGRAAMIPGVVQWTYVCTNSPVELYELSDSPVKRHPHDTVFNRCKHLSHSYLVRLSCE